MSLSSNIYRLLLRKRINAARDVARWMAQHTSRADIEAIQVQRFNDVWRCACASVPFYKKWREKHGLPEKIGSLGELDGWPILRKSDLRDLDAFRRTDVPEPSGRILTGGSTGEPVRLPCWGDSMSGVSLTIGRQAYGINPGDRTLLLWGHEHLYGKGFKRKVNIFKRRFKDWLADWRRISAYDLSEDAMRRAYAAFADFRPKFLIGFSPAVLAFVRHNRDRAKAVGSVRVVLCTAGPLTSEEKKEIEDFFGGVVCMEYGSVECGVMAYTRPRDGQYNVFWNTHLLQALKDENGEYRNIVTRLADCYVPLIRYDIGDYLELDGTAEAENARSVLEIRSVKGRPSEMISFACGVSFFGALVGDCVKQVPEVVASQIAVCEKLDRLEIRVVATKALSAADLGLIRNRFELTVANAGKLNLSVVQVDKLHSTVGGKVPRVVRL